MTQEDDRVQIVVRVRPAVRTALKKLAKRNGRTMAGQVEVWVREELEALKAQQDALKAQQGA